MKLVLDYIPDVPMFDLKPLELQQEALRLIWKLQNSD